MRSRGPSASTRDPQAGQQRRGRPAGAVLNMPAQPSRSSARSCAACRGHHRSVLGRSGPARAAPPFDPERSSRAAMSGRTRPRGRPERPARPAETSLERVPMRPIRGALARRAMRGSRAPCPSDEASHASASAGMLGAPPAPVSTESAAQPSPARRQGNCAPARIARLGGGHRLAGFPDRWCSGGGGAAMPAVTSDGAGER